jgi:hypothetical protein
MKTQRDNADQSRPSVDARLQMVQRFRASSLSRRAFSKSEGVPLSTLDWWLQKAKTNTADKKPTIEFQELTLGTSHVTAAPPPWAMEVVTPGGWIIRCRETLRADEVARLLRVSK